MNEKPDLENLNNKFYEEIRHLINKYDSLNLSCELIVFNLIIASKIEEWRTQAHYLKTVGLLTNILHQKLPEIFKELQKNTVEKTK
jgi:hypothetical protein